MDEKEVEGFLSRVWSSSYTKMFLALLAALIFYRWMGFFIALIFIAALVVAVQVWATSKGGWKKVYEDAKKEIS